MPFLPWDNPDNIIGAETEAITSRVKDMALVFLFLIGGPGNLLNMLVFYKQSLQDRVNLCLFALALADEVYLVSTMFHYAEQVHLQFTTKERVGPMFEFMVNSLLTGTGGFFYVSNVMSAIIATERCFCVLSPLKFQNLMRTRTMAAIIIVVYVVVVSGFFVVSLRFYIGCLYDLDSGVMMKTTVDREIYLANRQFIDTLDSIMYGAGLPVIMMIVVIVTTLITVVKLEQVVTWRAESSSSSLSAREVALTKMLVFNSVLFIVCVLPAACIRFVWMFVPEMNGGRRYHNLFVASVWVLELFSFVNSSFNIFVFYTMGSRYRETLWALFGRKLIKESNTALIYSAAVGNDVATELLTRNFRRLGLQVDHYNKQGNTALHVATKNGNLNCAKILAQRGRASVNLKDKEHGLTPMEWCLKKGYEKDEVDFLKPNTRFYRVAKLATSLSRSRASVGSLSLEPKAKVSPTKSLDSGTTKGRAKVTLSRSKSQAVESSAQGKTGGVFRQSTMDGGATGNHRQVSPRKSAGKSTTSVSPRASGKKLKDAKNCKEDKDKSSKKMNPANASIPPNHAPDPEAPNTTVSDASPRDNQVKALPVKISRKYIPGTQGTLIQTSPERETSEDPVAAGSSSGRLTGLGCSLSITSMQSSTTSLGSYDSRCVDSPPASAPNAVSFWTDMPDLPDNASGIRSMDATGADIDKIVSHLRVSTSADGFTQPESFDTAGTPRSGPVKKKPQLRELSIPSSSQDDDYSDDESPTAAQRTSVSSAADGKSSRGGSLKRTPSLRDIDCKEVSPDAAEDTEDFSPYQESTRAQSLTRLSEESSLASAEEQRPEAGHKVLGMGITSPLPALSDCGLRSSSGRQDSAIISHLRGAPQISQDA